MAATKDPNSVFYNSRSVCEKESTYYATDCSAFVSWCWGATRHTTYGIPEIATYKGSPNESNCANVLQVGDCLNSNSHIVLVTAITRNASGVATQIEITEQTPPQIKRSYYTPATLAAKYSGSYSIYRYNSNVPTAPEGSGSNPDDHTPPTTTIQYDGTTMPTGDGVVWVQCVLNKLGYTCDIDGVFGPGSAAKVKEFQSANGLTANGIVDSATLAKLKEKWAEKKGETTPTTFTITFDPNGGTCSTTTKQYTTGKLYGELPVPTKAGYTFDGWYTTKTGTNKITADRVIERKTDGTFYAHWTIDAYDITITFDAQGGECSVTSKTYTRGTKYGELPVPTREGYTFDGWFSKSGVSVTAETVVERTSGGAFYAKWTEIPSSSTMTLSVPQMTAHVGKTIEVPVTVSDNPGIAIIGFRVEYNTSVMTLKSIKNGDMFTECDGNVNATPFVFNAYTGKENATNNGKLVTLVFEIKADAVDGNYDIKVSECEAYNIDEKEVSVKAVNGSINVISIAYGDVNSDGKVDRSDLLRLAKYFSGHDVEINMIAADVNGDDKVDRSDLLRLAKYFSGHDVILGE